MIEAAQVAELGPRFESMILKSTNILDMSFFGSVNTITYKEGVYFSLLNLILMLSLIWLVCCLVIWLNFKAEVTVRKLTAYSINLTQILGCLCFMPFISIMFDVFVCTEAQSSSSSGLTYDDSFMSRDCYVECWKGKHLTYAIIAMFTLIAYQVSSVLTFPVFNIVKTSLHIKANPRFSIIKSCGYSSLVILRTALKEKNSLVHGLIFCLTLASIIGLGLMFKPFNYGRSNLMWVCSLCCVEVFAVYALMEDYFPLVPEIWTAILAVSTGFVWIAWAVLHRSRFRSIFSTHDEDHKQELFSFAFRSNQSVPVHFRSSRLSLKISSSLQDIPNKSVG
mmetsp:Transcript_14772/g.27344  ORF Transcript_14772/g.27344 Transcript_14772/m.27344 type:complete len:336 (-) Transcript_14772:43-1050(-)